jgi:isopentenyldiphosphate isomerase
MLKKKSRIPLSRLLPFDLIQLGPYISSETAYTDMSRAMEYFEVYNADGSPTHTIEERQLVHKLGLWHRTAHIWVYTRPSSLLLQKRGKNKDSHPGLWDVSAAGHIDAGETPLQCAKRELMEELGLSILAGELEYVQTTTRTLVSNGGAFIDNEFSSVYVYGFEGQESDLSPDPVELDEIRFIRTHDLRNMLANAELRRSLVPYDQSYYNTIISIVEEKTN